MVQLEMKKGKLKNISFLIEKKSGGTHAPPEEKVSLEKDIILRRECNSFCGHSLLASRKKGNNL